MGLKSIFGGIGKVAFPFIAAAATAGGPLGVMAAGAVGKALGVDKVDPTSEGMSAAIAAAQAKDPDALLKLEQAESEFKVTMQKLGFDHVEKLEAIAADDRASARQREIAVKDRTPMILASATTIGFFGLLGLLAFRAVPTESAAIVQVMVGSLGTAWIGVINYYYGSSAGSASKTAIMAEQSKK